MMFRLSNMLLPAPEM